MDLESLFPWSPPSSLDINRDVDVEGAEPAAVNRDDCAIERAKAPLHELEAHWLIHARCRRIADDSACDTDIDIVFQRACEGIPKVSRGRYGKQGTIAG